MKFNAASFFDFNHTAAANLFKNAENVYDVLPQIKGFILNFQKTLGEDYIKLSDDVYAHKTAKIAPSAFIAGPTVIGAGTEIRHCAFIRGSALIGENCVIGNSTELKNVIVFDNAQLPHYNYVGDSVIGYRSHMGAGSITSNLKSDKTLVTIKAGDEKIETGLKKFGAILGDNVEVGCGSVLNPGTIIGQNSNIYPLSMVRGYVPENSIYKNRREIVTKLESR